MICGLNYLIFNKTLFILDFTFLLNLVDNESLQYLFTSISKGSISFSAINPSHFGLYDEDLIAAELYFIASCISTS